MGVRGRKCEGIRLASLPVRQPNAAAQESGTGATRQSRWLRADGFAVLRIEFDLDQCTNCDGVVEIISRASVVEDAVLPP